MPGREKTCLKEGRIIKQQTRSTFCTLLSCPPRIFIILLDRTPVFLLFSLFFIMLDLELIDWYSLQALKKGAD